MRTGSEEDQVPRIDERGPAGAGPRGAARGGVNDPALPGQRGGNAPYRSIAVTAATIVGANAATACQARR
jgi:hypothetical protein